MDIQYSDKHAWIKKMSEGVPHNSDVFWVLLLLFFGVCGFVF